MINKREIKNRNHNANLHAKPNTRFAKLAHEKTKIDKIDLSKFAQVVSNKQKSE